MRIFLGWLAVVFGILIAIFGFLIMAINVLAALYEPIFYAWVAGFAVVMVGGIALSIYGWGLRGHVEDPLLEKRPSFAPPGVRAAGSAELPPIPQ